MRHRRFRTVGLLFAIALAVRLLFLLETRGLAFRFLTRYTLDAWYFWTLGQQLAQHGFRYSEAFFMPPFYPCLLGLLSLVSGPHPFVVVLIQLLLGSGSGVLLYLLAERLFDRRVALVSLIGYLLCGNLLFLDTVFLPNAFTVFGGLLLLYLLLAPNPGTRRLLVSGLVLGLMCLIRPETLLFLPLLLIVSLIRPKVLSLKRFAWLLVGSAVAVLPVSLHNLVTGRGIVLVSYNGGLNLYLGNNPKADGTWQPSYPLVRTGSVTIETLKRNSLLRDGQVMSPSASSSYWTSQAIEFVRSAPARALRLAARKLGLFISSYEIPNNYYYDLARSRSWILRLAFLPFGLILGLGVAGVALRIARLKSPPPAAEYGLYLLGAVYLATGLLVFTVSRLRAPIVPLLLPFGALFAVELVRQPRRHWPLALAAAVVLGLSYLPLADRRAYAAEGLVQAGNIYLEVQQPQAAREEYQRAARLEPTSVVATYGLFNSATKLKNRVEAERFSSECYRLSRGPADSVYAFLSTAKLGTMTSDFGRARDYYLRALEYDPSSPDTRYLLAMVYCTLQDFAQARQQLEILLELNPLDQQALSLYHQLLTRGGP